MPKENAGRKQEILNAALDEFIDQGISGARMKTIAGHTGVTKAMIHYYFDTKENLFQEVFREASGTLMAGLMDALEEEAPLFVKIEQFIDRLLDRFHEKPALVRFVVTELNQHAELTADIFQEAGEYKASVFREQLDEAASNYEIAPVEPNQLIGNIISLCMFPYSGRGMLQSLLTLDDADYRDEFLQSRRELIKDTIINGLAG